jgi:hypothetical protein
MLRGFREVLQGVVRLREERKEGGLTGSDHFFVGGLIDSSNSVDGELAFHHTHSQLCSAREEKLTCHQYYPSTSQNTSTSA